MEYSPDASFMKTSWLSWEGRHPLVCRYCGPGLMQTAFEGAPGKEQKATMNLMTNVQLHLEVSTFLFLCSGTGFFFLCLE
jgi:hypothetical protein